MIWFYIYFLFCEDFKYVNEVGCNYLGFIIVDILNIREGFDCRVFVWFIFGGIEIRVEGVNEKIKKVIIYMIIFFGNLEEDKKYFGMLILC